MTRHLKHLSWAITLIFAQSVGALEPTTPYPGAAPGGTNFLNKAALLGPVNNPAWFNNNIPFLELPDAQIQSVYYYRWVTYKENLAYTGPVYGWLATEFLSPVFYGAPYGGISAAAGHHITEGRWLRNQQYVKDVINYWLNGPGQFPKPREESVNADTNDWAHEYSFWAGSAVWQTYLAHGDRGFATGQIPSLVKQYRGWDGNYNSSLGLYWQKPVWDASEFTPASYDSPDPYHGGPGYRPTINAYQFGDAKAIAGLASLVGDTNLANEYNNRANSLQSAVQTRLWDRNANFFKHMHRDNNPNNTLLDTRELHGYVPWMFNMPQLSNASAMQQLLDPQGFKANYGPTTSERRATKTFMKDAGGCCHWNGPSWPFQTSQVLTGVANLLIDSPSQPYINKQDYLNLLRTYAATQFRNGVPYVAEAHNPDENRWQYDSRNHSEDYNHSTYNDNVISGLIGMRGQPDNTLVIKPLAPESWDYFALENTPYHGHNVTVLWDRTGSRYGQGSGLNVYVDGRRVVANQGNLNAVRIDVGNPITQNNANGWVNVASNPHQFDYGTKAFSSYLFTDNNAPGQERDSVWQPIDGVVYRTGIPQHSRWTSYASTNASDFYGVNFQRNVTVKEVRLTFYDDAGGVRAPTGYDLQYWNGSGWANVPGQTREQGTPQGNAMNRITFPQLTTSQLRVLAPNRGGGTGWGLSEFEAYAKPVFKIVNENSKKMLAVEGASQVNGAQVQQYYDNGTRDHLWELVDAGNGYYMIRNLNSNLVLGVDGMSTADSALIKQAFDNGSSDHLWQFVDQGVNGRYKIRNKNSGRVLGVDQMKTTDSANIVQFQDNGTLDHLWRLYSADDPR